MKRPPIQSRSVSLSASLIFARCTRWNGQTTKPEVTKPEEKDGCEMTEVRCKTRSL